MMEVMRRSLSLQRKNCRKQRRYRIPENEVRLRDLSAAIDELIDESSDSDS